MYLISVTNRALRTETFQTMQAMDAAKIRADQALTTATEHSRHLLSGYDLEDGCLIVETIADMSDDGTGVMVFGEAYDEGPIPF
jgi:uncharacterized protein YhjY with autotransporter beta-barrel domain